MAKNRGIPIRDFLKGSLNDFYATCFKLYNVIMFTVTRGRVLDRVHNSRQTLDRLFALLDPVALTYDLLT